MESGSVTARTSTVTVCITSCIGTVLLQTYSTSTVHYWCKVSVRGLDPIAASHSATPICGCHQAKGACALCLCCKLLYCMILHCTLLYLQSTVLYLQSVLITTFTTVTRNRAADTSQPKKQPLINLIYNHRLEHRLRRLEFHRGAEPRNSPQVKYLLSNSSPTLNSPVSCTVQGIAMP